MLRKKHALQNLALVTLVLTSLAFGQQPEPAQPAKTKCEILCPEKTPKQLESKGYYSNKKKKKKKTQAGKKNNQASKKTKQKVDTKAQIKSTQKETKTTITGPTVSEKITAAPAKASEATVTKPQEKDAAVIKKSTKTPQDETPGPTTKKSAAPISLKSGERMVKFNNGITKNMIGYKYLFFNYYPSEFKISINGTEIPQDCAIICPVTNNTFVARYDYNFKNGYRIGQDEVTFTLDPETKEVTVTFAWHEDIRILVDNAKVQGGRKKLK